MCGRVVISTPIPRIAEQFDARVSEAAARLEPRFNVAPTDPIPVLVAVRDADDRRIESATWGIVPPWARAKGSEGASRGPSLLFNIRSETAAARHRQALSEHRCAVVVDGFYEWSGPREKVRGKTQRVPWFVFPRSGKLMALAAVFASDAEGVRASLLTTAANATMSPIHDRMPVCLDKEQLDAWLDPGFNGPDHLDALTALMRPWRDDALSAYRVAPAVNSSRAQGPALCEPLAAPKTGEEQKATMAPPTLF